MPCTSAPGTCNRETGLLTSCAALVQKVPVHFGEGERLFYGQVQDAAVPIRQALAHHPEAGSSWAVANAQTAPDDAPPSPREPAYPTPHSRDLHRLGITLILSRLLPVQCQLEGNTSS